MTSTQSRPASVPPADLIRELVTLSRHYGVDPEFVLAGGGNTSAKTDDTLWVKGSGHALATIDPDGFVAMDRALLDELLATAPSADRAKREEHFKHAVLAARLHPELGQRPSVESVLHHMLPRRFVVHTHPTPVNMLTCCRDGQRLARELLGEDVLWVPYVDPGLVLAHTLHGALQSYAKATGRDCPTAVLMANHGLIVCGDSSEEVHANTQRVVGALRRHLAGTSTATPFGTVTRAEPAAARALINTIAPALRGLLATGENLKVGTFDDSPAALELAGGADGAAIALGGPLCPDQIVYCTSYPLWFEPRINEPAATTVARLRQALAEHKAARRFAPNIILVKGVGLFAAGDTWASANTARQVYLDSIKVMAGAVRLGGVHYLVPAQYQFIEDWEVEAYRKQIAAGSAKPGRVVGKVAVVTGAAQGFGLEIAQDLAAQGAHVALTDVNEAGTQKAAGDLAARHGPGRAIGLPVNVTDGASVDELIHQVVRAFGGFDVLVSNAGVLRAGSVKTQPERDFDVVTAVNYKGYFLCVQKAAPILATQRLAKPGYTSDIIQINSKSGLQGSNRNGAYAGSKFGGVGLTQSFALELIDDGIKVNAICPGNFFDGPLWSDPNTGLFVQYLHSGKVPGAKTIADVKKFYEAKVPMGRGCTTADVMQALYYLIAQQYETGQALPVTGGQVMLG